MKNVKITDFLKVYINKYVNNNSIIKNPIYLTDSYIPEQIKHRDNEISKIIKFISPVFKGNKAPNILIYGPTGTGKTLVVKFIGKQLNNINILQKIPIKFIYLNCRLYTQKSTSYYILKDLVSKLTGKYFKDGVKTGDLINNLIDFLEKNNYFIIVAFDEIDILIKNSKDDDFLYLFTRDELIFEKNRISFIGISNNLDYLKELDARVLSSLSSVKIGFKPYNAIQLYDILKDRAEKAFEKGAIEDFILKYIAAWVAKESGDARKAIAILRLAGNIADSEGSKKITLEHVEKAIEGYDIDAFLSEVEILPIHFKLIILAIFKEQIKNEDSFVPVTQIYERYKELCNEYGYKPLSKDSVLKKIKQLETFLGDYIEAYIKSFGREGRKKVIKLNLDKNSIKKMINILEKEI